MDWITLLIFAGFILTGMIIAFPVGYLVGRRSVFEDFEVYEEELDWQDVVEEKR